MERLTKSQQEAVKILSTDKLRLKLLKVGYNEEVICEERELEQKERAAQRQEERVQK